MFFWNFPAFSMIQQMLAIWSLVPLPFLNPAWTSGIFQFKYGWSHAWRILSTTLLAYEMSAIVQWFEHYLALPFFGIGVKTDVFQSTATAKAFKICSHTECSTLTTSSFRTWNNSAEIPSPPLTLFVVTHQFSSVQSLSHVRLFATPWITAHQASLSITNSRSSSKLLFIESVMPSSHLILCCPLLHTPNPSQHQ